MKPKDLVGIPWMVAFALREAGWYFRSDIIWEKPNCMPESVKDRPTRSHEYLRTAAPQVRRRRTQPDVRRTRGKAHPLDPADSLHARLRHGAVILDPPLRVLQISFFQSLERLRSTHLLDALLTASSEADIHTVDRELGHFADNAALQRLAGWGLRGEILFALPSLLRANPHLLGYYRLLLGFSKKQFYGKAHGLSAFKSMEEKGA